MVLSRRAVGRSTNIKKCETVVGCGVSCLQNEMKKKKRVVWVILVTTKTKRSQRPLSILESKKLRDTQAGPRFRMVKATKRQAANNDVNNIASDTRGERWATILQNHVLDEGSMCPSSENY